MQTELVLCSIFYESLIEAADINSPIECSQVTRQCGDSGAHKFSLDIYASWKIDKQTLLLSSVSVIVSFSSGDRLRRRLNIYSRFVFVLSGT